SSRTPDTTLPYSPMPSSSSCAFFFSSRRRHTRFSRDWSSDVCSSDLQMLLGGKKIVGTSNGRPVLNNANTPANGVPEFNMNVISNTLPTTPFQNVSSLSTTWQMQIGLRYIFK